MILTPTYDGKLYAEYVNSLVKTIEHGKKYNIDFSYNFLTNESIISHARNILFASHHKYAQDSIIWIDSDIQWNPAWAIELVLSRHDVAGGIYPIKNHENEYPVKLLNTDIQKDGFIEVAGCGMGFLKMSRNACIDLWTASEQYEHNNEGIKNAFYTEVKDFHLYSEDYVVCERLRNLGYKIMINPEMTCNHIGKEKYRGDFKSYVISTRS